MSVGGCEFGPNYVACSPRGWMARRIKRCPICNRRTWHIITLLGMYGTDVECYQCGHRWQDGQRITTPEQAAIRVPHVRVKWRDAMTMADAVKAETEYLYGEAS